MHEELMAMQCESSHFYEVLPNILYAGACPWESTHESSHLHELFAMGIRDFITLRDDVNVQECHSAWSATYPDISLEQFPIQDYSVPQHEVYHQILNALKAKINSDSKIYVSCAQGLGRTGLIIACFLSDHLGITGNDALELMNQRRKQCHFMIDSASPETQEQIKFVMEH